MRVNRSNCPSSIVQKKIASSNSPTGVNSLLIYTEALTSGYGYNEVSVAYEIAYIRFPYHAGITLRHALPDTRPRDTCVICKNKQSKCGDSDSKDGRVIGHVISGYCESDSIFTRNCHMTTFGISIFA